MKSQWWIGIAAPVIVACFMFTAWQGRGAEQGQGTAVDASATGTGADRFEGKHLIIRMDRALDERDAYLQKVRVQTIGGESFLVGQGISLGPKWKSYEGRTVWVSVRHIEQMYQFDSLDEINKMYEKTDE